MRVLFCFGLWIKLSRCGFSHVVRQRHVEVLAQELGKLVMSQAAVAVSIA